MENNNNNNSVADNSTNSTDYDFEIPPVFDNPVAYIVPVVFVLIFILGAIGNITVIIIVLKNQEMRTTPNILIVSLAIGDLFLILVSVPFTSTNYTLTQWHFGDAICRLCGFLRLLTMGVSIFTLTALSADRYLAIARPMRSYLESSMLRTLATTVGIWVLSAGLGAFGFAIYEEVNHDDVVLACQNTGLDHFGEWFICFKASLIFVIYFVAPMMVISTLYILMALKLWKSSRLPGASSFREPQQTQAAERQAVARKKVARLVLALIFIFIICWLPRYIYIVWHSCSPPGATMSDFWMVFKTLTFCLSFLNSCVNPIVLCILSDQFRGYFKRYLCCCCVEKRPQRGTSNDYTMTENTTTRLNVSTSMLYRGTSQTQL